MPRGRQLIYAKHLDQLLLGNGCKDNLHRLSRDELGACGMPMDNTHLVRNISTVLLLSNQWLEELYYTNCGQKPFNHLTKAAVSGFRL